MLLLPEKNITLSLLPLRDLVVYPHMVVPLFVGREKSIQAIEHAIARDKLIFLCTQKDAAQDDPTASDLYPVGTIASVLQVLKLPDGTVKVLVEGLDRARINRLFMRGICYRASLQPLLSIEVPEDDETAQAEQAVLIRTLRDRFEEYIKLNKKLSQELLTALDGMHDQGRFADTIVMHLPITVEKKQEVLQILAINARLERVLVILEAEIDLMQVEVRLQGRVKNQMERNHREFYLNEKIKAIHKELGDMGDGEHNAGNELDQLQHKIEMAGMSEEALDKALNELKKLRLMPPMSAEATVLRNYLDWLLDVPWQAQSEISEDLAGSEKILEADHYGLEKVKERIIEHLAVQQRVKKLKGPIICLVGPPGVGKTSLGQSIAAATGREFIRISLGGMRDEAEIRGHRRTYIGALPGKIIQKLAKVKVRNPLFMLDEVDKMAMDFRGDPASALLEVLDPEQNHAFNDHYLEVDYDLSHVMFIATANDLDIPPPLLDRMEVIRIPGYTEDEKRMIATRYLIPKQMRQSGLDKKELKISPSAVMAIIQYYTREAGVRGLERELAKICRKVVKEILTSSQKSSAKQQAVHVLRVSQRNLEKYLGVKRFRYGLADERDQIGQVRGLAWTKVGGELLTIEAVVVVGKGKLLNTGTLGDVMKESIQAAMTVVRSRAASLGISADFYEKHDVHIHMPEGATPKDGPSAGVGMCTALVSALTKIPVKASVAMTGEITLRGEILPIGGLKEKLLAALRGGIKTVIIPEENEKDLKEIPKNVTEGLEIRTARWIDTIFEIALQHAPEPLEDAEPGARRRKRRRTGDAEGQRTH